MKNKKDLRKAYDRAYALAMTVQTEEMKENIINWLFHKKSNLPILKLTNF